MSTVEANYGRGRTKIDVADETEYARAHTEIRRPHRPGEVFDATVPTLGALTPRELDTLELVRDGATNKQLAAELGITEQTAKNHMSAILRKLGAPDRTAAVVIAIRAGQLELSPGTGLAIDPVIELERILRAIAAEQVVLRRLVERAEAALERAAA